MLEEIKGEDIFTVDLLQLLNVFLYMDLMLLCERRYLPTISGQERGAGFYTGHH